MNGLTKKAYLQATPDLRDEMTVDWMLDVNKRLERIEGRKWLATLESFLGGVLGGVAGLLSIFRFSGGG